jgi:hypothetical protein
MVFGPWGHAQQCWMSVDVEHCAWWHVGHSAMWKGKLWISSSESCSSWCASWVGRRQSALWGEVHAPDGGVRSGSAMCMNRAWVWGEMLR